MTLDKRKALLMLSTVIVLAAVFWPAKETPLEAPIVVAEVSDKAGLIPAMTKVEAKPKPLVVAQKLPPKPAKEVSVERGMQHEMQRVADIYEQRSQYAPYSLFLSAAQTDLINPNQSHESPRAYDVLDETISILIKPRKYRFSTAEHVEVDILITSSVAGVKSLTKLEAYLRSTKSKQSWPFKILQTSDQKGERSIQASIDLSSELGSFDEKDYSVVVSASFNGDSPVMQSAPIQLVTQVAKVVGLGVNRIEDNDLIIPINIDADQAGYYQVSASLFDRATNSAVSYLIAKQRLSSGSNILDARVQGLVLRDKGFSGPFRLQGITLVKKSERPGMAEAYGMSADSYEVEGVNLEDFESIPYQDPMTEQRLEFMRSIGQ
jgi:hypothetical protein